MKARFELKILISVPQFVVIILYDKYVVIVDGVTIASVTNDGHG